MVKYISKAVRNSLSLFDKPLYFSGVYALGSVVVAVFSTWATIVFTSISSLEGITNKAF